MMDGTFWFHFTSQRILIPLPSLLGLPIVMEIRTRLTLGSIMLE